MQSEKERKELFRQTHIIQLKQRNTIPEREEKNKIKWWGYVTYSVQPHVATTPIRVVCLT